MRPLTSALHGNVVSPHTELGFAVGNPSHDNGGVQAGRRPPVGLGLDAAVGPDPSDHHGHGPPPGGLGSAVINVLRWAPGAVESRTARAGRGGPVPLRAGSLVIYASHDRCDGSCG